MTLRNRMEHEVVDDHHNDYPAIYIIEAALDTILNAAQRMVEKNEVRVKLALFNFI